MSLNSQYTVALNFTTLKVFAAVGDTQADVRTAFQNDFSLDPTASLANRAELAKLVSAWSSAKEMCAKEKELFAESKVLGTPRILQHSERQAMIKAVENVHGCLPDSDIPSNEYLALKVEECENDEPIAASLDEVSSRQDKNTSTLQSTLDNTGHVRVTKVKTKGKLPETTEGFRKALKIEAITWLCMAAKFKAKHWLSGLKMADFTDYIEYVLGDKVYSVSVLMDGQQQPLRPSWNVDAQRGIQTCSTS